MNSKSFTSFAASLAILAGVLGFFYALSFIVISRSDPRTGAFLSGLFLMLSGIVVLPVQTALYKKLKQVDDGFSLWAFLMMVISAVGMMVHGGYDLANALHPVGGVRMLANLPSQTDPRGLLSFGIASVGIITIAWLLGMKKEFPKGLSMLGYVLGVFLAILYLGRLILLNPANPVILYTAVLNGFVVNPVWYIWLGMWLKKSK